MYFIDLLYTAFTRIKRNAVNFENRVLKIQTNLWKENQYRKILSIFFGQFYEDLKLVLIVKYEFP